MGMIMIGIALDCISMIVMAMIGIIIVFKVMVGLARQ